MEGQTEGVAISALPLIGGGAASRAGRPGWPRGTGFCRCPCLGFRPSGFQGFKEADWDGRTVWEYVENRSRWRHRTRASPWPSISLFAAQPSPSSRTDSRPDRWTRGAAGQILRLTDMGFAGRLAPEDIDPEGHVGCPGSPSVWAHKGRAAHTALGLRWLPDEDSNLEPSG